MQWIELLLWVPVISLLAYIPYVCYMDWMYREVKHNVWKPLLMFNIPVYIFMVITGAYEQWMILVSFVAIGIYFMMMRTHLIEGADFVYMSLIALFLVISPVSKIAGLVAPFTIFLVAWVVSISLMAKIINSICKTDAIGTEMFPMMIPISVALIFTVVLV